MGDRTSITGQINLYGMAVDSRQWDLFDGIFTPDVHAEYGGSPFTGLEAFKQGAALAWGRFDCSQHAMSNTVIRVDGDQANALTYGSWCIVRSGVEGGDLWEGRGWYDDRFVRVDDRWLITRRLCRVMWGSGNPRVMQLEGHYTDKVKTWSLHEEVKAGRVQFFA